MNTRKLLGRPGMKRLLLGAMTAGLFIVGLRRAGPGDPDLRESTRPRASPATRCIPSSTTSGEAFRRNGYQFPSDEDVLVKEEPVKLGIESYKDMFPNSIWPSTLPSIPPISLFTQQQNIVNLQPHGQEKTWDLAFPSDIELIGAGTFGKDISALWIIIGLTAPYGSGARGARLRAVQQPLRLEAGGGRGRHALGQSLGGPAPARLEPEDRQDRSRALCPTSSPRNRSRCRISRRCRRTRSPWARPGSLFLRSSRPSRSTASSSNTGPMRWGSPTAAARPSCRG